MNRNVLLVGYLTFMAVAATALNLQFDTISKSTYAPVQKPFAP